MRLDISSSNHGAAVSASAAVEERSASVERARAGDVGHIPHDRPRWTWLPYIVLALGLISTALITAYIDRAADARAKVQFKAFIDRTQEAIADRLDADIAALHAVADLAARPSATPEDLRRALTAIQPRAHAAALQDLGISREVAADASHRAAMEQARDTGVPVATGRVNLAPSGEEEIGFLVYAPIYQGGPPPLTVAGRRAALAGFVHVGFPARAIFQGILGGEADPDDVDVDVYAGAAPSDDQILHRSGEGRAGAPGEAPRFTAVVRSLEIAGRPFTLSFATRPGFERGSGRELVPFIIGAGLIATLILFLAMQANIAARADAEIRAIGLLTSERARREEESRRMSLEEAEGKARRAAEEASRIRDELLATLSHELRTPLTAVMGWVRMLRGGSLNEATASRALEVIERNVKREAELVEDLLDVSGVITGKLRLEVRPIAIEPVVAAAVAAAEPASLARSIHLDVAIMSPGQRVIGDPERLRQVIWNLLSNAIRFTPCGGRVKVGVARLGAHVAIAVTDTGRGISPEFLPFVFDRFRKADSSVTYSSGGLGLGLSLARHLVELHGGTLRADSPGEGHGATFTVLLPVGPPDCGVDLRSSDWVHQMEGDR